MGLVVHPGTADVHGWGMLEELLFDGVLVEPGDGAQPPGHGGAGPAPDFEVPGEALDVGAADSEQVQAAGAAPGGEKVPRCRGISRSGLASGIPTGQEY